MKPNIYLLKLTAAAILALSAFTLGACDDIDSVDKPSFKASAKKQTVKVGEKVQFVIAGTPDVISFYSGEVGNTYAYSQKDRITPAEMSLSFSTITASGTVGYPNPAYAPISYSTDFDGQYDEAGVNAATWIDISDNFKFPRDVGVTVPAGSMDIGNIMPDDSPIFIRYDYKVKTFDPTAAGGLGNGRTQVTIRDFFIKGVTESGTIDIYDIWTADWKIVLTSTFEGATSLPALPTPPATARILLRSEFEALQDRNCWAVSGPMYRTDDINTGPDRAVGIKATGDPKMNSYEHIYTKPGTYMVTFVAANVNVNDRKQVITEFEVTVVNDSGEIVQPIPGI